MINKKKFYTSVSKGGEYELVGTSHGAGKLKGIPLIVYRDPASGQMFHREPEEFAMRMKAIPSDDKPALAEKNKALLASLIEAIEGAGFSVIGPTNVLAAENGEPAWVCNARAVIAEAQ